MMSHEEIMMYDTIAEMGIATPDELNLARNVAPGTWKEILNMVVYVRTGYHTLDDYLESIEEEE